MARGRLPLMHSLFLPAARAFHEAAWQPPADVIQTRRGWLVKFELAGVRPEDITVTVSERWLTVRGVRRDIFSEEGCCCYRLEISYSHFERTLEFPTNLEQAGITTDYQYGMLLVRIEMEAHS